MEKYILISLISYLIGTIPTAWLLVKFTNKIDIRNHGTGNVGAMNSYEITGKKWVGITVFIMDALKGILAVIVAMILGNISIINLGLAAFFSVAGHNFNIFLKMKGGRGLATAAGSLGLINPLIVIFWGLMWLAGYYIIKKDIHVANITATIGAPLMFYYTSSIITDYFMTIPLITKTEMTLASATVCLLILIRHIKPMIELLKNKMETMK